MAHGLVVSLLKAIGYLLSSFICFLRQCIRNSSSNVDFKDDIVLITGAAQGLGKELALEFASRGGVIVLWDINETKIEETRAQLKSQGCDVFAYVVDCSNREEVYRAAEMVKEEVGNVSVLVNNAGVMHVGRILDLKDYEIDYSHSVNALSHYWVSKLF